MKDNKFVYCAWRIVLEEVFEEASKLGVIIGQIIFKVTVYTNIYMIALMHNKTDRPSGHFWKSGMVLGVRELAQNYDIPITHITEQSMHNKVSC